MLAHHFASSRLISFMVIMGIKAAFIPSLWIDLRHLKSHRNSH
jgi:hypothetical protein